MSTRRKRLDGFSLVELLVALAIGSIVLSAMMLAASFASRRQAVALHGLAVMGQEVLAIEALRASLRGASYIVSPSPAGRSYFLAGYTNADQSANFAPLLAGRPQGYFFFCTDAGPPRRFYRYSGPLGSPPKLMPPIICGQAGGESLAGDSLNRLAPSFRFSRASDCGNVISVEYSLSTSSNPSSAAQIIEGQTSVQTQAPLL